MTLGFFDTKTKSKSTVTPYRQSQLDDILNDIQLAGNKPFTFFGDQTYAGFDPLQTEALQGREATARGQGAGIVDPAMQAWQSTLGAPDVASNPYVQGMLEQQTRLANRNLEENILPMLSDQASIQGGVGGYGGSGHSISEGIAARGTQEGLLNQAAQTQMDAYGKGLAQQQFGINTAPGMMQIGMAPYDTLAGVGSAYQGMDQQGINEAMARHQFEQEEPWARAEREAGLYQPLATPYATRESESKDIASGASKISQSLGLMSSLGGALTGGIGNAFGMPSGQTPPSGTSGGYSGGYGGYGGGYGGQQAPSSFMPMNSFGFQGMGGGGGGGGAMSMMPMLMSAIGTSDRRLKSNIVHIGHTPGGQRVYEYDIFGTHQVGVMADESPAEAVIEHPSGYLMVDYSKIR